MTRLTLEINAEKELDLLYRLLDALNIEIVKKEQIDTLDWNYTKKF